MLFLEAELPTPLTDRGEQENPTDQSNAENIQEPETKPEPGLQESSVAQEESMAQAGTSQRAAEELEGNQTASVNEGFSAAFTNEEGEPLMAMILDDSAAPNTATDTAQEPAVDTPTEATPAAVPSSSSRHRHGDASQSQARLQLLRDNPEVVSRFLRLIVPILFDVYSASVTLQVRMRCFTGILKATSFVDGDAMEPFYRVRDYRTSLLD